MSLNKERTKTVQKPRVVMAMSGGVDSCVAAAVLIEQGYEVIGMTMQLWNHGDDDVSRFDSCCSLSDVHDARRTAHMLGIPHYVVNYEKEFKAGVVDYFASEYGAGRTPNPCVMCNSKLKFDHLIDRAQALGAEYVATGHYAILEQSPNGPVLKRGVDSNKDQSYFLFHVNQKFLPKMLFPLGDWTKPQVRQKAAELGMPTAKKHESQEICFVTGKRYSDFLDEYYPEVTAKTGEIVDREGNVLGNHDGIHLYTVGQRKGLGHLAKTEPLYVEEIDADKNLVIVGKSSDLSVSAFEVANLNWLTELKEDEELSVVVRYRAKPVACRVELQDNMAIVHLSQAAKWVTPGQAAVFYRGDQVVGGGFIAKSSYQARGLREAAAAPAAVFQRPRDVGTDVML